MDTLSLKNLVTLHPVSSIEKLIVSLGIAATAILAGLIAQWVLFALITMRTKRSTHLLGTTFIGNTKWHAPALLVTPTLFLLAAFPSLHLPARHTRILHQMVLLLLVGSLTFLGVRIVDIVQDFLVARLKIDTKDNLHARKAATQINVLEKVLIVAIILIGTASGFMLFDRIRQLGVSLLASAGIVGITLGFAAQKTISNIFAGIQLALTQPIRIDDVVIVENEWGWIEEITLTYVVVRIWDLRRLIVPVSYFIDRPFQNWTRTSAGILGTVYLYADYTIPLQAIREKLKSLTAASPLWDKKVCGLQVTNATDRTLELRALVSSEDSPKNWDLRCYLREELVTFLQKQYPDALPRIRVETTPDSPHPKSAPGTNPPSEEDTRFA